MLSNISFNDFYEEVKLDSSSDKNLSLIALLNFNKDLGKTQIQKLLFLAFAEGKVILPFKFKKHNYGPFSQEIEDTIVELRTDGFLNKNIERVKVIDKEKEVPILSETGKTFLKKNQDKIKAIMEKLEPILLKYEDENGKIQTARSLERYCYETYFLKLEDKSEEEHQITLNQKIKNLIIVLKSMEEEVNSIKEVEEVKKILILSSLDYIKNLLGNIHSPHVDQVIKGVLIKNCQDYIENWGEILTVSKSKKDSTQKISSLLLENRRLFRFINEISKEYEVFDSVFPQGD